GAAQPERPQPAPGPGEGREGDAAGRVRLRGEVRHPQRSAGRALLLGGRPLPDERPRRGHRRPGPGPGLRQRDPGELRPDRPWVPRGAEAVGAPLRMSATRQVTPAWGRMLRTPTTT